MSAVLYGREILDWCEENISNHFKLESYHKIKNNEDIYHDYPAKIIFLDDNSAMFFKLVWS